MGLHRWISKVPGIARRPKAVVAVLLALAALLLVGQAAFAQTGPPTLMSGDSVSISPGGGVIFPGQSVGLSAKEYASADYSWSSDGASFSPSGASGTTMTVNSGASGDVSVSVTVTSGAVTATGSATFTVPAAGDQLAEGNIAISPASVSLTPGHNVILEAAVLSEAGGALASGAPWRELQLVIRRRRLDFWKCGRGFHRPRLGRGNHHVDRDPVVHRRGPFSHRHHHLRCNRDAGQGVSAH